jgi:ABC-type uncharacterized transport system permease subunit
MVVCMVIVLAVVSILLVLIFPGYNILQTDSHPRQLIHVLSAAAAFSVLCVGGVQAALLCIQERLLRRKYTGLIIQNLPPLETMERLLFQMIGLGFLLLSMVLASSAYLFHDLFQPPLLHKTILTLLAWIIFAVLLGGRYFFGWRGRKVAHYTFSGLVLLMMIYFGSQLFMEFMF